MNTENCISDIDLALIQHFPLSLLSLQGKAIISNGMAIGMQIAMPGCPIKCSICDSANPFHDS